MGVVRVSAGTVSNETNDLISPLGYLTSYLGSAVDAEILNFQVGQPLNYYFMKF